MAVFSRGSILRSLLDVFTADDEGMGCRNDYSETSKSGEVNDSLKESPPSTEEPSPMDISDK